MTKTTVRGESMDNTCVNFFNIWSSFSPVRLQTAQVT